MTYFTLPPLCNVHTYLIHASTSHHMLFLDVRFRPCYIRGVFCLWMQDIFTHMTDGLSHKTHKTSILLYLPKLHLLPFPSHLPHRCRILPPYIPSPAFISPYIRTYVGK